MTRCAATLLSIFVLLWTGCVTLSDKSPSVPYHQLYQAIDEPAVAQFIESGLELLRQEYGPLEFAVTEVLVRQSKKNDIGKAYRISEGFSLTEIIDAETGIFAIYISVPPNHVEFYPLLAHEIGHLKQPSLVDNWEMEGFCMVFSGKLCRQQNKDWSPWKKRFQHNPSDPYALAYRAALLRQ